MSHANQSYAWYALRRSLPLFRFDELLEELVDCLPRYGVDEIIVIIDAEEFFHGHPRPEWIQYYQQKLFRIKEDMDKLGIAYSLNPWVTHGHADRGRDARKDFPGIQTIITPDGTELTARACPLCSVWQNNMTETWTLLSQTQPKVMWVEDDIRAFGENACFCPLHLKKFSERIGQSVSREQLVEAILQPGQPHPWRQEFLKMESDIMTDTAAFLAQIVHDVSSETRMGLMSSGPRNHCMEGRDWNGFTKALTKTSAPLYSRPTMGNYWEDSMRGLYHSQDSIKITRYCCPEGTIEHTELENVPFTRYSKTTTFSFLQMAISFAFGSQGVAINIYDHLGTPMEAEAHYGKMLGDKKPYLNAIAEYTQQPGVYRGVRLLHNDKYGHHCHLRQGDGLLGLTEDGFTTMQMLESLGIPTVYEESPATVAVGQQLQSYSDEEILAMLGGGLLLDAAAAEVLQARGFGEHVGLKSILPSKPLEEYGPLSAEEHFNTDFGGAVREYMTTLIPAIDYKARLSEIEVANGATVISRIVDPDTNPVYDCMTAFENKLGGRVVVHAWDYETALGVSFNGNIRRRQMQFVIRWLSKDKMPLLVDGDGAYPLAFRKDCANRTILGFFNLTLDPWQTVKFQLADHRKIRKVSLLSADGCWQTCTTMSIDKKDGVNMLTYNEPISFDTPRFWLIEWEQ